MVFPSFFSVIVRKQFTDEIYMLSGYRGPTSFQERYCRRINERRNEPFLYSQSHLLKKTNTGIYDQSEKLIEFKRRDLVKTSSEATYLEERNYFKVGEGCKDEKNQPNPTQQREKGRSKARFQNSVKAPFLIHTDEEHR